MEFVEGMWRSLTTADAFPKVSGFRGTLLNQYYQAKRYVKSYYLSRKDNSLFGDVRTYCMFVGHARSGGSVAGALLDAHPNIILADEVDVLKYVAAGFTRDQIYHLLLTASQYQAGRGKSKPGRDGKAYTYQVPGQWQGRFDRLQVIGDRKAGKSILRLGRDPRLLQELQNTLGDIPIRLVHVVRNPYDTISTLHLWIDRPVPDWIEHYFKNCATLRGLYQRLPASDLFVLKHEAFLSSPESYLKRLCEFVELEADEDYLQSCASILYKNPAKSRSKVAWKPEWIKAVKSKIEEFEFLQGYSFEG